MDEAIALVERVSAFVGLGAAVIMILMGREARLEARTLFVTIIASGAVMTACEVYFKITAGG